MWYWGNGGTAESLSKSENYSVMSVKHSLCFDSQVINNYKYFKVYITFSLAIWPNWCFLVSTMRLQIVLSTGGKLSKLQIQCFEEKWNAFGFNG